MAHPHRWALAFLGFWVRWLLVMFSDRDECSWTSEDLIAEGFGRNTLPKVLHSLLDAGILSRQLRGASRTIYRLRLASEGAA